MEIALFFMFVIIILFVLGILYWIKTFIIKINPDFKWWIRYKILRKKYREEDVMVLLDDAQAGIDENELFRSLLISGRITYAKSKELRYIYKEIKAKLKGGIEKK